MYCVVQLQWDGVDGLSLCRFNTYLGKDESVIEGKELVQVVYIIVKRVNVSDRQLPVNLRDDEMPVPHAPERTCFGCDVIHAQLPAGIVPFPPH